MVRGFSMTLRPKRARSSAPSTVFRAGGFRNGFNGKAEDRCFETTFGPRTAWSLSSWSKERIQDIAEKHFGDGAL